MRSSNRSLAEENATLQQRVRQVSRLCCATQAQGAALLPQPAPADADPALAGAELVEDYVSWVGCFCLAAGLMHAPALQAQVLCCGLSALPQRLASAIVHGGTATWQVEMPPCSSRCARSAGLDQVSRACVPDLSACVPGQHVCQVSRCARSACVPGQQGFVQ